MVQALSVFTVMNLSLSRTGISFHSSHCPPKRLFPPSPHPCLTYVASSCNLALALPLATRPFSIVFIFSLSHSFTCIYLWCREMDIWSFSFSQIFFYMNGHKHPMAWIPNLEGLGLPPWKSPPLQNWAHKNIDFNSCIFGYWTLKAWFHQKYPFTIHGWQK